MNKKVAFLLLAVALGFGTRAQIFSLTNNSNGPLWINLNRVYNYNQYEKSRWGVGLCYGYNVFSLKDNDPWYKKLWTEAYIGYGYADKRFKWGATLNYWTNPKRLSKVYTSFFHDLTPEASRILSTFELSDFTSTSTFMERLFSDSYRLTLGASSRTSIFTTLGAELRLSRERKLYGAYGLVYPQSDDEWDALEQSDFAEGRLYFHHETGLTGEAVVGYSTGEWQVDSGAFFRILLQYSRQWPLWKLNLNTFAQVGYASNGTPMSRQFNLGGTWGSAVMLGQSMLTVRPDEFCADHFALVTLRLGFREPLFKFYSHLLALGTAPRPFVCAAAEWGISKALPTPAPDKGIAEVGAGIDGLVQWGMVSFGFGVAYRLTPSDAPYHFPNKSDNLLFVLTTNIQSN